MTTAAQAESLPIGARIVWARKQKGISQERLAETIGTSRRHMIRLEKGVHRPGPEFVRRIAEATGQPLALFADGAEPDDEESDPVAALMLALRAFVRAEVRQGASA